jgi:ribosomal protein L12E/L44/L45/RPP1/RPP2
MSALTNLEAKLLAISPELEAVIAVLQVAQSVTGLGGPSAAVGIKVLDAALKALEKNASGVLTHDELMAQVTEAHGTLAAARATEDAELTAKLPAAP